MGKYTNSGKPYMGMRGMDFSNPKAVDKVSMFPKSCMFCQGNTNSKDSICYQCKKDGLHDLVTKNEELMVITMEECAELIHQCSKAIRKKEFIEWGTELDVNFGHTWTCYKGEDKACGECTACSSRLQGFIEVGRKDPLPYSKFIPWATLI